MDYFLLFGILGFSVLILSFLAYKFTTDKIIKEQEKENAALRTENMRLQAALRGKRYVRKTELYTVHLNKPKAVITPDFKE